MPPVPRIWEPGMTDDLGFALDAWNDRSLHKPPSVRECEWGWITIDANSSQRETNTSQPPNAKNKRLRRSAGDVRPTGVFCR